MKKIAYTVAVLMTLTLTACEDYLTLSSPDGLTSDSFWRDKTDVESALSAAYSQLYFMDYSSDRWSMSEVIWPVEAYREDIIKMGSDAMNYQNWVDLYNYTFTNGNSQVSAYWRHLYRGINFANQILEKSKKVPAAKLPDTEREQLMAEAHFLRAYYHMRLLLNWKEIIIRNQYITSGEPSALDKALSSRTACWDFVVQDLNAATALPESHSIENIGRATRGAAYAYLGWAYLTRAAEENQAKDDHLRKAIDAFNKVTGYELNANFAGMFNGQSENSKESIFEMQFTLNDANGANYRTQMHRWIGCSELMGWDEILPAKALIDEFMKEGKIATDGEYDNRLYATIFYQCDYWNAPEGRVYGKKYDDWFTEDGKAYNRPAFRKFMPATIEELGMDETAVNIPLMRYANVLLMKAEALNQIGETAQAIKIINEVRKVHGNMPAMKGSSKAEVQAQIEHERAIEFPLENLRFYDLRRWGKLEAVMKADGRKNFTEEAHAFYPVPQTEINANGLIN